MIKMPEEATPTSDEEEKTMYHMGFAYMNRLNLLLYQCNEYARNDDIEMWYKALMNLYKELETQMNETERENEEKNLIAAKKKYDEYVKVYSNYMVTISNPRNRGYPFNVPNDVLEFMFKWEISLRKIIDRIGMLMPKAEDARFAMLG